MKIKVAAIQMNCELANVDANLARAEKLLKEAVDQGAKWWYFQNFLIRATGFPNKMWN